MQLVLKPVNRKLNEFKDVCNLMRTAFPKDELISLTLWRALALRNNINFFAVYEVDKFIGIIYIVEYKKYLYVPFLAILEGERNKKYGSQILDFIKEQYKKILVLHIEPLDPTASNYKQRVRRAEFYNKNWIEDTFYRFKFFGVMFAIYSSDCKNFDINLHKELMEWFAFHIVRFKFKKENNVI